MFSIGSNGPAYANPYTLMSILSLISVAVSDLLVLFGYSPDAVEGFIEASNANISPPSTELDNKSRRRLESLGKDYERLNEDFIC